MAILTFVKGAVAWQIQVNAIYDFFLTTAHKRMDMINWSTRASVRERARNNPKVLLTLRFRVCCTHVNTAVGVVHSRTYPIGPESGHEKDTSLHTTSPFKHFL